MASAVQQIRNGGSAAGALWRREVVRFLRQRNRVIGALGTPVVFWLLLGFGLDRAVAIPTGEGEVGYLTYFFPGTVTMIVLFTAIFATIRVIEDRKEGFLQGVLASPAPRWALVLGLVLGGATLSVVQGMVFVLLWPVVGGSLGLTEIGLAFLAVLGMGLMLTGVGFCLAWPMESTAAYHAIMNLVLMPAWFLSGAVFPIDTAPVWMKVIMYANPLTYGQAALAESLGSATLLPSAVAWGGMAAWVVLVMVWATRRVSQPRKDGT